MIKITGLDELQKDLRDASRALAGLDGTIAELRFDPGDRASVDAAIRTMERAIDAKVSRYRHNSLVEPIVREMKANYKSSILQQVRKARG